MRTNALSAMGRLGYSTLFLVYPAAIGYYYGVHKPSAQQAALQAKQDELDTQLPAKQVDPDLFNPFSTIPFHNNPELKYIYANTNLTGYVNPHTHLNEKDYLFKGFNDSYDHGDKKRHLYNWTSVGVGHH